VELFSPLRLVGDHIKVQLFRLNREQRAVRGDAPLQLVLFVGAVTEKFESFQIVGILSRVDFVMDVEAVVAELPDALVDLQIPDRFHVLEQTDGLKAVWTVVKHHDWDDVLRPVKVSLIKELARFQRNLPEMLEHERNAAGTGIHIARLQPVGKSSQLNVCRCSKAELPEGFRLQKQIHHVNEIELKADKTVAGHIDGGFHVDGKGILRATKTREAHKNYQKTFHSLVLLCSPVTS
jgi:hypothetical protein